LTTRYPNLLVTAGLDPAINPLEKIPLSMDARVKPAHDEANKNIQTRSA